MRFSTILTRTALIIGALAADPPCGTPEKCAEAGRKTELDHTVVKDLKTDTFYNVKDSEKSMLKVGSALRVEKVDLSKLEYTIPGGVTMYRMLYGSASVDDSLAPAPSTAVPASAFILIPYTNAKGERGKLDVIAWAHGTSGIERQCAPSTQDNLYYEYEAPFSMALQGFAVVAPDYSGQGTEGTFHYLHGPSHASDMANAVKAARSSEELANVLTTKWVAVGHSEGGLTAWATNEREANSALATDGFQGAVSIGPALANLEIISTNLQKHPDGNIGDTLLYPSYTLSAIQRFNPKANVDQYYTANGLTRRDLAKTGCFNTALGAFAGQKFGDIFKDKSWLTGTDAKNWQKATAVTGEKALAKPMLVIAGVADVAVPLTVIKDAVQKQRVTFPSNKNLYLSEYPGMDHDPVAFASQLEYFDWIRKVFDGMVTGTEDRVIGTTVDFPSSPGSTSGKETGTSGDTKRSYAPRGSSMRRI